MATTMLKSRQMTMSRKSQLSRVNHDVREVFVVYERDHLKNHRWKQMIRMIQLIHRKTLSLLIRVKPLRGVHGELHVTREIRLMPSRQKTHKIRLNCHVNRMIHRTSQLQIRFQESSYQPKHLDMQNEQTSLQTSHLFSFYP
jgi:hypothetical protein